MDFINLKAYVNAVAKEKDLPVEVIKEAVEHALIAASRKNLSQFEDARAELDMETGSLNLYVRKKVVNEVENDRTEVTRREARRVLKDKTIEYGDEIEMPIDPADFGRIAAQSARQIVMQRIRDAERSRIHDEFTQRVGQVVTGTVQRFERRDVVMNIGRAEGVLPLYEQPMGSHYKHGDRLKVLIQDVRETPKGPLIVLSRKSPNLVVKLFEQEVPEIADGTIKIIGVAREAGVRTKIAVTSISSDVDPVGACVGMKGSRVQMVVRELDNEKIDIVPHSIEPIRFVTAALNPAKILTINLNEKEKRAEVIVARGNLAIAIGRKGQNTKLAARLTGWRLDIRSEEEEGLSYEEIQVRYLEDFLMQITGLSNLARDALLRSQYSSVDRIARAQPTDLLHFTNNDIELAEKLVRGAAEYVEALQEMQEERKRRGLAPGFFMPSEFAEMDSEEEGEGAESEEGESPNAEEGADDAEPEAEDQEDKSDADSGEDEEENPKDSATGIAPGEAVDLSSGDSADEESEGGEPEDEEGADDAEPEDEEQEDGSDADSGEDEEENPKDSATGIAPGEAADPSGEGSADEESEGGEAADPSGEGSADEESEGGEPDDEEA